jgi:hypothetical protein
MPSTPRYSDSGSPGSGGTTDTSPASSTATSRQPMPCSTSAPSGTSSDRELTTRPMVPPCIVSPSSQLGA